MTPYDVFPHLPPMALEFVFGVVVLLFLRQLLFKPFDLNSSEKELDLESEFEVKVKDSFKESAITTTEATKGTKKIKNKKKGKKVNTSPLASSITDVRSESIDHHDVRSESTDSTDAVGLDDEDKFPNRYTESMSPDSAPPLPVDVDVDVEVEHIKVLHSLWQEEKEKIQSSSMHMFSLVPSFIIMSFLEPRDVAVCRLASLDFWGWLCRKTDHSVGPGPRVVVPCKNQSPRGRKANNPLDNIFTSSMSHSDSCLDIVLDLLPNISINEVGLITSITSPFKNAKELCDGIVDLALLRRRPDYAFLFISIILQTVCPNGKVADSVEAANTNPSSYYEPVYSFFYNSICSSLFSTGSGSEISIKTPLSSKGGVVKYQLNNIHTITSRTQHASKKKSGGARSLLDWIDTQTVDSSKFQFLDQIPGVTFCNRAIAFLSTVSAQQVRGYVVSSTLTALVRCHLGTITWAVSRAYLSLSANVPKSPKKNTNSYSSRSSKDKVRASSSDEVLLSPLLKSSSIIIESEAMSITTATQAVDKISEGVALYDSRTEDVIKIKHDSMTVNPKPDRDRRDVKNAQTTNSRFERRNSVIKKEESNSKKYRKKKNQQPLVEVRTNLTKAPTHILRRNSNSDKSIGSAASGESKFSGNGKSSSTWNNQEHQPTLRKRRSLSLDTNPMNLDTGNVLTTAIGSPHSIGLGPNHNQRQQQRNNSGKQGTRGNQNSNDNRGVSTSTSPRNANYQSQSDTSNSNKRNNRLRHTKGKQPHQNNNKNRGKRGGRGSHQNHGQRRRATSSNVVNSNTKIIRKFAQRGGNGKPNIHIDTFSGSAMNAMAAPFIPSSAQAQQNRNHESDQPLRSPTTNQSYSIFQPSYGGEPQSSSKLSSFPKESWSSPPTSPTMNRPSLSPSNKEPKVQRTPSFKRLESVGDMEPLTTSVDLSFLD
eukprot:CAMPEP_0204834400 /NCGR_PEP_ID=MMETSP1346-20131115/19750_1 /ASSEMBLY_ACC=CAM_ASM_000771 /TAXON_ID=215587 /ORGANISM="Aplanochytrium stocchinoi, Strain GSBS06" /LENGTH=931 /DNA_ID=CAMNT_0051967713 /DNA_START=24 /DNA_END=2819 /DNA_ORIENTATION=+